MVKSLVEMPPPWRAAKHNELLMLTLYERPIDWPDHYVVRAIYIGPKPEIRASTQAAIFRTEIAARNWIDEFYPTLTFTGKDPDDTKIIGVWT